MKKDINKISEPDEGWARPDDEKFDLTMEGLAANKAYLKAQREAGNPDYQYKGNATKKFIEKIIDANLDREWEWVKSVPLPDTLEKPVSEKTLENEIEGLVKDDKSWKTRSPVIKKFHPSVLEASREGLKSPAEGWRLMQENKENFRKFYSNRLRCSDWFNEFHKNSENFDAHWPMLLEGKVPPFIYSIGLTTSGKFMNVSMFKPHAAKYLVKKYLSGFSEIFDPFSGFSGRLLGVVACGKKYIGLDISPIVISESKNLMKWASPVFMKHEVVPVYDLGVADACANKGKYECLMTCSPYGKTESWKGVNISDRSCDDWIDVCLANYDCKRYVFVTDGNITKYRDRVVETWTNQCHWGKNEEFVVVIDKK